MNQCRINSFSNPFGIFDPARAFPAQNLAASNSPFSFVPGAEPSTVYRLNGYELRVFESQTGFNFDDCFLPPATPGLRPLPRPAEDFSTPLCRDPSELFSRREQLSSLSALLQSIAGNGTAATQSILASLTSTSPALIDASVRAEDQCVVGFLKMLQDSADPAQQRLFEQVLQVRRDVSRADTNHDGVVNNAEMFNFVEVGQRAQTGRVFQWQSITQFRAATHAIIHELPLALSRPRLSSAEVDRLWHVFNYYTEHRSPNAQGSISLYGLSLGDFPRYETEPALITRIRAGNLSPHEWAAVHAILTAWNTEEQAIYAQGVAPLLPEELSLLEHFLSEAGQRHESFYGLRIVAGNGGNVPCPGGNAEACDDERRFIRQEETAAEIRGNFIPSLMERSAQEAFADAARRMAPFELNNLRYISASALMARARAGQLDPQEVRLIREWMMPKAIEAGVVIPGTPFEQSFGGARRALQGMFTAEFYFRMLIILAQHSYLYQQTIERWHFGSRLQSLCGDQLTAGPDLALSAYERGIAEYTKAHAWAPWAHRALTFLELMAFNYWIGPWKDTGNMGIDIITDAAALPFFRWLSHVNIQWTQLPRMIQEHPEICQGEYHEAPATETEQSESAARNASALMEEVLASAANGAVQTLPDSAIRNPYLHSTETGVFHFLFPPVFSPVPNSVGVPSGAYAFGR